MSFCTKCGRQLTAGVRFCTGCGAVVPQPVPAPPAPSGQADVYVPPVRSSAGQPGADARPEEAGRVPGPPARDITVFPRRRFDGQRATVALVVAAVLVAGGIIAGFQLAGHHGQPRAAGHAVTSQQRRSSAPPQTASLTPVASSSASPTPSESGSAPASSPSAPSAHATTVAIGSLAAGQPHAARVAAFLSRYFAAIKHRNYAAYAALFAANAVPSTTARQFRNGYRSTRDSGAVLVNLSASAAGLVASVTFRSHQDPAASATHTSCTLWGVAFYLQPEGNSYLIGPPPAGYHASYHPCP
ncbi:MAG TPA: zinc ribbon domain-containing protein [Streptosporangiaceae bacterium]|nr:zinc ribbon domain-containing protein [Streptosporangiaceae bacterium]